MKKNVKIIAAIAIVSMAIVSSLGYYSYFYLPNLEEAAKWKEWADTLVVGTLDYEVNPDPHIGYTGLDLHGQTLIADALFWSPSDKVGEIRYQLAEKAEVKYEGINGTQYPYLEVKLRQGLHFNNGEEVTAEDVVYSHIRRLQKEPGRAGWYAWVYNYGVFGNQTFVALDRYTVKFRLPSSFPMTAIGLNGMSIPSITIVSKAACEKYGEGLDVAKYGCSGPLILIDSVPKQKNVYTVRENYKSPGTGGWVAGMGKADEVWPPRWKTLIVNTYADSASLAMALKKGEVDISAGPHSLAEIKDLNNSGMVVRPVPGACTRTLMLNFNSTPLNDLRVRQAIVLALDPMENIEKVTLGSAQPAKSMVHSNYFYYEPAFQDRWSLFGNRTSQKLDRAKALLAEAGYPNGFEITYVSSSVYAPEEQERNDALIIQNQLRDIGIKVNIQVLDSATFRTMRKEGKIPMFMAGFYPDFPDPENDFEILTTNGWQISFPPSDAAVRQRFRVDEFSALDIEGKSLWSASIPAEQNTARKENYKKQQQLCAEYVYAIPYYFTVGYLVSQPYVKNLRTHWFVTNWATPGVLAAYKEPPKG